MPKKSKPPNTRWDSCWTPRSMRMPDPKGQERSQTSRETKRSRVLGSRVMRKIYTHAHGHKHPDYGNLCIAADKENNMLGKRVW